MVLDCLVLRRLLRGLALRRRVAAEAIGWRCVFSRQIGARPRDIAAGLCATLIAGIAAADLPLTLRTFDRAWRLYVPRDRAWRRSAGRSGDVLRRNARRGYLRCNVRLR